MYKNRINPITSGFGIRIGSCQSQLYQKRQGIAALCKVKKTVNARSDTEHDLKGVGTRYCCYLERMLPEMSVPREELLENNIISLFNRSITYHSDECMQLATN
jgi:hypothetical protein